MTVWLDWLDRLFQSAWRDTLLLVLCISILLLFILAVCFALYAIALRLANHRKKTWWEKKEKKWEGLILSAITDTLSPAEVRTHIHENESLYFVDYILRYARQLRGYEKSLITTIAHPYLPKLAERTKGEDPERRARAIQTLSAIDLDNHADMIIEALDDPSPLVSMIAARGLARKDHPQYAKAILAKLARFSNWSRSYIASMLVAVGPQITEDIRRDYQNRDKDPVVRAILAETLRQLNDLPSADVAARIIQQISHRDLLASSLRLLAQVGRPDHLASIRPLTQSEDFVVRACAMTALGSLGEIQDRQILHQAFDDPSSWVAIHAARALQSLKDVDFLNHYAQSDRPRAMLAQQMLAEGAQ